MIDGVMQVSLPATDLERATAFYRDKLGLRHLMSAPNAAFFDCSGIRLYVDAIPGTAKSGGNSRIYFRTADIERSHALLKERGVEIYREPHVIARLPGQDLWLMWIRDSEDNLVAVMEERRAQ